MAMFDIQTQQTAFEYTRGVVGSVIACFALLTPIISALCG
jgi:hypothetical protein